MQEVDVIGGGGVSPETLLDQKKHLLKLIEKVGQENFEKHFLFREESDTTENIATLCGISLEEVKQIQEFILDMSVQSEFYHPSHLADSNTNVKPTLVGRIVENNDKTFSISFFSPHLARGMYTIDYDALRRWQKEKHLDRPAAARLRKFMGLLEISNLRQGAFWRVIDYVLKAQKDYFATKDETKMAPVSLRKVAKHLQFAPSTISRVMALKSVLLPWDHEVMLLHLMPGQRKVVLSILEKISAKDSGAHATDMALSKRIEQDFNVKVSRRTITACRHVLNGRKDRAA
jgi:DNA-directed RNA polymerase specialized sigma54-like protein